MRIIVSNVYADDNRGSAALTRAAVRLIRAAFGQETQIDLLCVRTNDKTSYRHTRRDLPDIALLPPLVQVGRGRGAGLVAVARSLKALRTIRCRGRTPAEYGAVTGADLVVGRGGYVFAPPKGVGGCMSLWLTALPLVVAQTAGVPTVILGSGIGPFGRSPGRWLAGWILRRASLVMARDARSARWALSLGVDPSRLAEVPDTVFTEEAPTLHEIRAVSTRLRLEDRFAAVTMLAPRNEQISRSFVSAMSETLSAILSQGLVDRIYVVAQVRGPQDSDLSASEILVEKMHDERVRLISADLSVRELLALYARAEFTLATRLHSAILSIVARTPAFGIAMFGIKTQGVFESLGFGHFAWELSQFDSRTATRVISEAMSPKAGLKSRVTKVAAQQHAASLNDAARLRSISQDRAARLSA